jgi:hypothetical protein
MGRVLTVNSSTLQFTSKACSVRGLRGSAEELKLSGL